jgi:DNA-binding MarR family transcriptional regulator
MAAPPPIGQELTRRLRDGLDRICAVMRAEEWTIAGTAGLTPTQIHALTFIAGRAAIGARVGAVAAQLGVTQPTATESIAALVRKGLLTKTADPEDPRAVSVRITPSGRDVVRAIGLAITATERAIETLSQDEQASLLRSIVKTIRALQVAGAIAPQRLCVTCKYFRAHAHADRRNPHHCDYVDKAFGVEGLQLDCAEHEAAPAAQQQAVWQRFDGSGDMDRGATP